MAAYLDCCHAGEDGRVCFCQEVAVGVERVGPDEPGGVEGVGVDFTGEGGGPEEVGCVEVGVGDYNCAEAAFGVDL